MNSQTLHRRTPEIAGCLLLISLASIIILGWLYDQESKWAQHSVEVQVAIKDVESAVRGAEGGQRGFLLTNNDIYLTPYLRGIATYPDAMQRLNRLIADNPDQTAEYAKLKAKADERMARMTATLRARQAGEEVKVAEALRTHRGFDAMEQVEVSLRRLGSVEDQLWHERMRVAEKSRFLVQWALLLGVVTAVVSVWAWVTSARRARTDLENLNDALTTSLREQENSAAQIRQLQKMETLGHLTGGIAHDFNNMLAIVMGGLDMAKRRIAKGDMQVTAFLDGALEGAKRGATLTQRLLAFSRKSPLSPQIIDINVLAQGMEELLRRTLGESIALEFVLGGGVWATNVDALQLEAALLNLAVNARDAMPTGGRLTVETLNAHLDDEYASSQGDVSAGQYVVLAVTDTGEGMAPEIAERAFEPFFTTKKVGKGTGLGLSQVYGFVKQSGGHIKICSELRVGTTIKIYLPRAKGKAVEVRREGSALSIPFGSKDELVLVVEDEAGVRRLTVDALRELGYTVRHASSGEEALQVLDDLSSISLLFTDVVMPGISGRQLAEKALRKLPDLKILYTSGYTHNAIIHNGVVDADAELLSKPFTIDELARKVRKVLA